MKSLRLIPVLFVTLLATLGTAWAQDTQDKDKDAPLSSERPGFTAGPDTVAMGHIQFETGYTFTHDGGGREHALGDGMQLRVPIRSNFEARLGLPSYLWERGDSHAEGLSDSSLSLKYHFLDASPKRNAIPSLALIVGVELPTGKHDFREDDYQPSLALEANWKLTDALDINANTVYSNVRQGGTRYDEWGGGISLNIALAPQWGTFAEVYRVSDTGAGTTHQNLFDTGLTYQVGANTQLDITGGCGVFGTRNSWFLGGGIARRW